MTRCRSIPCLEEGLKRTGFEIAYVPKDEPTSEDVLVIWNRLHTTDAIAKAYEAVGAKVVVCENGWIGKGTYAIALNQHNGAGWWRIGSENRWPSFGIELKPYRTKGEHVLVVPQRGMGIPPVGMPRKWGEDIVRRLASKTDRPIMVRHPAFREEPIEHLFEGAHACVIWASGAGIKAIVNGCPVFHEMPLWIGGPASEYGIEDLEYPNTSAGLREYMLYRLSWAMWKEEEVSSGFPFQWLLRL